MPPIEGLIAQEVEKFPSVCTSEYGSKSINNVPFVEMAEMCDQKRISLNEASDGEEVVCAADSVTAISQGLFLSSIPGFESNLREVEPSGENKTWNELDFKNEVELFSHMLNVANLKESHRESYIQHLQLLFEQVDESQRGECYLAIVEALQ